MHPTPKIDQAPAGGRQGLRRKGFRSADGTDAATASNLHDLDVINQLRREIEDLKLAQFVANEHADSLQEYLLRLNTSLAAEVRERQATEEKLQKLVRAIKAEKADLEILVQILNDQGDVTAAEGEKARIDPLTQVANRRRFDEYFAREWERHLSEQRPLSILVGDVDHFKQFNDHYGHQAGDECLRTVADQIRKCFRAGDLVARYGGEEFAMALPHTPLELALRVAERVRSSVQEAGIRHEASPVAATVTLSIGVGTHTPDPQMAGGPGDLFEEADRNLYLAKKLGRNRVHPIQGEI